MKKTPTLRVRPNPFHTLDAEGMPGGIARVDPTVARPGAIEFIGAVMTKSIAPDPENQKREPMYRRRKTSIRWAEKPVEIVDTELHRQYVKEGTLIAEDEVTAKLCGVVFLPPAEVLVAFKKKAIAEYVASHGEEPDVDAWDAALKLKTIKPAEIADATPVLARPWDAPVAAPAAEVK